MKHIYTIFPNGPKKVDIVVSRKIYPPSQQHKGETILPFDFESYFNNSDRMVAWKEPNKTKKKSWRTQHLTTYFENLNTARLTLMG